MQNLKSKIPLLISISIYTIPITLLLIDPSFAGQDPLDVTLETNVENLVKKIGKIVGLVSFGLGMVGSAIKFNPYVFGSSLGISADAIWGTPVITGLFSAII